MEHESRDLLKRIVLGELDIDADEVRARLASDPAFAVELDQVRGTLSGLAKLELEAQEVTRGVTEEAGLAADDAVEGLVQNQLKQRRQSSWGSGVGTPRLRLLLSLAALALITATLWGLRARFSKPPTKLDPLGPSSAVELFAPEAAPADALLFRWEGPRQQAYTLRVSGYQGGGVRDFFAGMNTQVVIARSELPDEFEWWLEWRSESGSLLRSQRSGLQH